MKDDGPGSARVERGRQGKGKQARRGGRGKGKAKNNSRKQKGKGKSKKVGEKEKKGHPGWKICKENFSNPNLKVPFHDVPGPQRAASGLHSPLEYLKLFFTMEIFQMIVDQTNLYYQQSQATKKSKLPWTDVSMEEIMTFLGIVIAMGISNLPEIYDYWSTEPLMCMPWYSTIFSRNRFSQINRYLHLVDNTTRPQQGTTGNKLFKLGKLPENLIAKFKRLYIPSQNLSVDEQMIGTKSRISFIQYMPKKPKKFGIKLWVLCESLSGYCLQFQIYTGKCETGATEHGLAYRVVFDLLEDYLDKGYHLYLDNFYTSLRLISDLAGRGTFACGTIRRDRGEFPGKFQTEAIDRGSSTYLKNGNIVAVHWKDKRDVYAISSIHGNGSQHILRRGETAGIDKPDIILEYNKYMNGVDKCDQYLNYYSVGRKSKKWWKKLFYRLLELCIVNAMVLHFNANPEFAKKRQAHKLFRIQLVHELVQPLLNSRDDPNIDNHSPSVGRRANLDESRLKGKHFPESRYPKRRRCSVCGYTKGPDGKYKDTKTSNYCPKCQKFVCKKCFEIFHTQSKV